MIIQIVILAVIAAALGLKLYSVLGRRAEHEEESIPARRETDGRAPLPAPATRTQPGARQHGQEQAVPAMGDAGIRAIAAADRRFDIIGFLEGARAAYAMTLEAFWKGDRETLREMCDADVYAAFDGAISAREAAGETLDNRLVRIEETRIENARLDGTMAHIAVRFVADMAAVTRDADGNVIAGSLDDAIEARDLWTFSRDVRSPDPHWLLDETDEG